MIYKDYRRFYAYKKGSTSKHIKNIYATDELEEISTCAIFSQVRVEGNRKIVRNIPFYNLDIIIAVGYRVNLHNNLYIIYR
ncbi:MAG: virulence RhuM family protein [Paludibacteraceae bacterium]|nr:virulence RhuM family protein [Paludibacteraceae bacterium]